MLPTDAVKWMPSANIKDLVNSGAEIVDDVPLTAHGIRKFTRNFNTEPKYTVTPGSKPVFTPVKSQNTSVKPPLDEDEVEIPIHAVKNITPNMPEPTNPSVSIYEETDDEGNKVESTFKDAIRLHPDEKKKGFWGNIFHHDDEEKSEIEDKNQSESKPDKISLKGAGIFNNETTIPSASKSSITSPGYNNSLKSKNKIPAEIESFKNNTAPTMNNKTEAPATPAKGPFELPQGLPTASKPKQLEKKSEEQITPYPSKGSDPQVAYVDLSKTIVPKEVLHIIPEKIARQYKVVPIEKTGQGVTVAMIDPQDLEAIEIIKKTIPEKLTIKLSSEEDINHILDQYSGLETELTEAIKTADTQQEEQEKPEAINESTSDNAPAARIVTSLLRRAIRDKASDIHIEPEEKDVLVRFRQDGILRRTVTLPKDLRSSVVSRIKIMANMKIDEQRLPQDGRFSIDVDNRKVDFRVSSMPVANGEKIVMRVLDKLTGILSIEELGITGGGLQRLLNNLKKSHGMILVTGPTGSGKTTSLYALIDKLYTEGVNIVTLEDPIEYRMPGINQSQVNAEIKYTFASGLRSIVRQDPDIIMIGEIRDSETAEMAVHAALTGHIVLSTLHTNDSAGAAPRLLDMGVEPFLLTSSLNIVIAQRLARKICQDCKEEFTVPAPEMEKVKAEIAKMPEAERPKDTVYKFYHGKGCKNCGNSGYAGRIGLYEVLEISEPIKELILKKESSFKIQELATKEGMIGMLGDGILKALAGSTSLEEVWRITQE